jgi:hypothetical protein
MSLTPQSKPTAQQTQHLRKRTGEHQRRSKTFEKAYWPYLPLLSIAALVMVVLGSWVLGPAGAVVGSVTAGVAAVTILL